jgi:hypothetical protein
MAQNATKKLNQAKITVTEEAVSGGYLPFGYQVQSLSPFIYDLNFPKFNYEAQRAMAKDAEVHAGVEFLVDAILEDGINTLPALDDTDANFEEAKIIEAFIKRNLETTPDQPFIASMKELIRDAFYHAHKIGEIVLRFEEGGEDDVKLVLDRIKPKPQTATAFVVDEFLNIIGLIGAKRGQLTVNYGQVSPENIIPKEKFLICTLQRANSDPRGVSQVTAAFEPFCDKQTTRQQFALWRKKCAIRSWTATTPPNSQPMEARDSNGQVILINGVPKLISVNDSTATVLARMENNTVAVFSDGTNVTAHELNGTGEQFEKSFAFNNKEIRKAILLQTMATSENDKGGLGSGGHATGERVITRRINAFRLHVADQISDFCTFLVELNFGADKRHLTPKIDLGDANKLDLNGRLLALSRSGYTLDPSQFDALDSDMGLPRRDENALERAINKPAPVALMGAELQ